MSTGEMSTGEMSCCECTFAHPMILLYTKISLASKVHISLRFLIGHTEHINNKSLEVSFCIDLHIFASFSCNNSNNKMTSLTPISSENPNSVAQQNQRIRHSRGRHTYSADIVPACPEAHAVEVVIALLPKHAWRVQGVISSARSYK